MARALMPVWFLCLAACPELPGPFLPEEYACVAEEQSTCPESHFCTAEQTCRPRLGCYESDPNSPGCDPDRDRCELVTGDDYAAVRCLGGTHLVDTATAARGTDSCTCPEALVCTAMATKPSEGQFPLFVVPSGVPVRDALASSGVETEYLDGRLCALPCSSEADCPGNHTCRPARVGGLGGRGSVGVCFPDMLTLTSSLAAAQPDPLHCDSPLDCAPEFGRPDGRCRVESFDVLDHPTHPVGSAWGARRALTARCTDDIGAALKDGGAGCADGAQCRSGACFDGRCAVFCDPRRDSLCPGGAVCKEAKIERGQGADVIVDRFFVCGR